MTLYAVAFNNLGKPSPNSNAVTLHIDQIPQAPSAPLLSPGDTVLTLIWEQSAEDDVVGYNIYRDNAATPLNNELIPKTQSSYTDIALTNGKVYRYRVTALDEGGQESLKSGEAQSAPVAGSAWGQ